MEKQIYNILDKIEQSGFEAFIVGGYVRDKMCGINSFDVDITTNAKPEELKQIFSNLKYNSFYSCTFKSGLFNFDITTYRIDEKYDGRRPLKVKIASSVQEDLKRRDFTINTILLDKNDNMIDYLNGVDDFKNKIIKEVYPGSMHDDYLRILRAIRFATILNFKIDKDTKQDIINNSSLLTHLSSYRIREELDKILSSPNCIYGLKLIKKFKIDKYLNIEFDDIKYTDNLLEMYSHMKIGRKDFFSNKELRQINDLKEKND